MNQKEINLSPYNPVEILGVNNQYINQIRDYYPTLKIIDRDNFILILGSPVLSNELMEKFQLLLDTYEDLGYIDEQIVSRVFTQKSMQKSVMSSEEKIILHAKDGLVVKTKGVNQHKMFTGIQKHDLLFAIGPAGTGKTYTAVALAVKALKNKEVKRIILTRPAVEAGENLGFLPGDLKDKLDPYMQPLYDALHDMIPIQKLISYLEDRTIEIAPLAFMRGRTLNHAFVILDEAQNASIKQMKMFLTRMGKNSKFIVTGDITQIDLPKNESSGLIHSMNILKKIKGIQFVHLTKQDIIRHKLVGSIIDAYQSN